MAGSEGYVGRLAPSPTGALHAGNVRTFMIAWLRARSSGGKVIMRIEDLDHPRDKPGAAEASVEILKWLGFDWDEEYVQSKRRAFYRDALRSIRDKVYPCTCSRKDVESAQSAPHAGEQLRYAGTCRKKWKSWSDAAAAIAPRTPCWRFMVDEGTVVSFRDAFAGEYVQDVFGTLGDFPLARDEDGAGYTLAVVADDIDMGVTEVVRGDDLLAATPAQILVAEALGAKAPDYCHVPLVVGPDGMRIAKRHGDSRIETYRANGQSAESIVGKIALSCGWGDGSPVRLFDLIPVFDLSTVPHHAVELSSLSL